MRVFEMAAPEIPGVTFTDGKIYRGRGRQKASQPSTGWIKGGGGVIPGADDLGKANEAIRQRAFWVIVHAKSGKICWTGKLMSVSNGPGYWEWHFTVDNTLNEADDAPGSGEDTVTVTVVNPDNGPSNPAPVPTNVVQVP